MQTTDTRPRRAVSGDEVDAVSRLARKHLACLRRAGVVTKTKRRIRRRERREGRAEIRLELAGGA